MRLQFDANQKFQLDAIEAAAGLFDGQPPSVPTFSVIRAADVDDLFAGQERSDLGIGNRLLLDDNLLRENTRAVQLRNEIDVDDASPLEAWDLFDIPANRRRTCPHFSVEMETGTGKTYVYLRTIFELSKRYGFSKFIIVVPSVPIREGVRKTLDITAEHFRALYDNVPIESFVYDSKKINLIRQFATANTIQIAIINIDAFRKDLNVIYKDSDLLSGRQPIEFVQAARPIVIIDEPQSVDNTEKAQEAIKALNPLCTLRYSATHRNPYNLIYRLDPIRAFELGLVKQIVVASAVADGTAADAFVRVEAIDYKPAIRARLRINVQTKEGPKQKVITARRGGDLFALSNERAAYKDGYAVAEINAEPGSEFVRFTGGTTLRLGDELGGMREDVWRVQIKHTVRKHLDRELQLQGRNVKVLTLFFVDRVANYRDYDGDGRAIPGKFAQALEEELADLCREDRYRALPWLRLPFDLVHDGYFASDKNHRIKDTSGATQADDDTYALIMRDKERLLSLEVPLRFIFSHSALREGWDSPNVFQICTLNQSRSALKKRQEIGRGLRLPVDAEGKRIFDPAVNRLFVMANESYEEFARTLQTEYEDDCGVTFGKVPLRAIAKLTQVIDDREEPIGNDVAILLQHALVTQGMLDSEGRIGAAFDPKAKDFEITLPTEFAELAPALVDLLTSYRFERHVRRERDEGPNRLKKEVLLAPEFAHLWDRIKPRTTYRVEFSSETLIDRAAHAVHHMERIEVPIIVVSTGILAPQRAGVGVSLIGVAEERIDYRNRGLPDILAYLQEQTDLTRSTINHILLRSGRLAEFIVNPQRFMDAVASILSSELYRLMIDGIKYERILGSGSDAEWEQLLFKDDELVDYLTAELVKHSVYEYVTYESEVERVFAKQLDDREDIKLFVKLPAWFKIDTPIGTYNPDWAIVKEDHSLVYLVRETKSTRDFLKLRNSESDKVRCGMRHFSAIDVPYAVVVTADEV